MASISALAERLFVHPFADQAVLAGDGTVGMEILDDLPDPDAVFVPYGGVGCRPASPLRSKPCGRR